MGRDGLTDWVGEQFTSEWRDSGMTPHEYVKKLEREGRVYDCKYNGGFPEDKYDGDYGSSYVSCHLLKDGRYISVYYIKSRDEWYAKY